MADELKDFLADLNDLSKPADVWAQTIIFFENMGLDRIICADLNHGKVDILTNFPQYWLDHYIDQKYELIDPFFTHCCNEYVSVKMGIDYIDRYEYLSTAQRKLIQEASEAGSYAGFSVTFKPMSKKGAGGWILSSSLGKTEVEKIAREHKKTLALASLFAREALVKTQNIVNSNAKLSPRETECLLWLVHGLRTKEIAYQIGIRPVTVELHLNNAKQKLGARTREQAVAKALTLQLIEP